MSFNFDSLYTKYEVVTGKPWNNKSSSFNDVRKSSLTIVSLKDDGLICDLSDVRDWCQDNFGDNWIYEWNDFYFKHGADAVLFRLRWI